MRFVPLVCLIALLSCWSQSIEAADLDVVALEKGYSSDIRPLVARYCEDCHSDDLAEADLNLANFAAWSDVRKHPQTWQKVGEMLDTRQMPPKDAPQPTDAERAVLERWVHGYLKHEAQARAGDPGRVVLRRLSNVEYTNTLRDLTGVAVLDPAREFPVDGAAGEGFTNTGNALVMSPSLVTKYLDAAKEVAQHMVLLPDGVRFSPHTTPRDWTEDTLAEIRAIYRQDTETLSGDKVNLQGIVFDTNDGGRLPLDKYFAATLAEREALKSGSKSIAAVAKERGLNAKYLGILWTNLQSSEPSLLLDGLRARWRTAKPTEAAALVDYVGVWQRGLWKFSPVGHIGRIGGPKSWQEPVTPLVAKQEIRYKIPASPSGEDVVLSLVTSDAGDGNEQDVVVWQQPRLVVAGRPDLLLRDVRPSTRLLAVRREQLLGNSAKYLGAAAEAAATAGAVDVPALAAKHQVEADPLRAWLTYLGVGVIGPVELTGHFTGKIPRSGAYDFVQGWGSDATPLLITNSSDQHVRVPGNMKPHGVAVHPSPTLRAAVGWRSPITANVSINASIKHAHPECGNGVAWSLELRHGGKRQRLASGIAHGDVEVKAPPQSGVAIQAGDLVSLIVDPRDGDHSCDLTAIDLSITNDADAKATWNLAADISGDVLSGNPHADRLGNANVWNFYTESIQTAGEIGPVIPAGSLLAQWRTAADPAVKRQLAEAVQKLLTSAPPAAADSPDAALYRQLTSLGGPLLGSALGKSPAAAPADSPKDNATDPKAIGLAYGLDPALFGKTPDGKAIDPGSLCVQAPSVIEIRLPADLAAGCELVTTAVLEEAAGAEGTVQVAVVAGRPALTTGLMPTQTPAAGAVAASVDAGKPAVFSAPVLARANSAASKRMEKAFEDFRQVFPAVLCYTKIVPVDEVVTLTLFFREDDHLCRLILDDAQKARLDRLWDELHYISGDAVTLVDAYAQLLEYATQDRPDLTVAFEPLRVPINERAAAYRKQLVDTEPKHLDGVLAFAGKAYRRPLAANEASELRALYDSLRKQELPHTEAIRLTLARVLVAPAFLYRIEKPGPGTGQSPVSDYELANRLSYFLWASQPDAELAQVAASGGLHDPDMLVKQMQRMLKDPKTRRLATEFGCQWLQIHDFDHLDEKSEAHFPTFLALRSAMYEESIQFFTDLFQNNGSVLGILDADHTFLNEDLAKHYGIAGVTGPEWRRVDGVKKSGRGGILGQSTTLAKQSGASRTSPILRGNWVSEVLLGERLPRPPKGVPPLPDDEAASEGLTVRQMVVKHTTDAKCMGCHQRIDPMGFSLESYDAIGRYRDKDLGDRPIDNQAKTMDGAEFAGLDGLRNYLLTVRREAFVRQFCKKLLGYALGRSVQLSDELLLAEMQSQLKSHDYQVGSVLETIVRSRQFREIRGRDVAFEE